MENIKEFFSALAEEIKPAGYRCFVYQNDESQSIWMAVITPDHHWLNIFRAMYGGFDITFQYVPCKDFGSGCKYNDSALSEITAETLEKAVRYGLNFSIRSKRYNSQRKPEYYQDGYTAMKNSFFGECYSEI